MSPSPRIRRGYESPRDGSPNDSQEDCDSSDILTIDEVAEYLRLRPQTIYKWAQESRIPAAKFGKEWRFRRSLIDLWVDDQMLRKNPEFDRLRRPIRVSGE